MRNKNFCLAIFVTFLLFHVKGVSQVTKALWVGETYNCDATSAVSGLGVARNISWSSSGGYISTTGSGLYRNVKATQYWSGTASVTCSWTYTLYTGGSTYKGSRTWYFTCQDNPVSIYPTYMEMNVGETRTLSYSHKFSNSYTSYADVYFSGGSSCVSVLNDGTVTAKSPGECYVNVYSKISSESPYCRIVVRKVDPTSVSLSSPSPVKINQTVKLTPRLYPDNATTTYSWRSDNTGVAYVDGSGNVTGRSEGTARITVTTSNNLSASCDVQVYKPVPSQIQLSESPVTLPVAGTKTVTYSVTPTDAIFTTEWKSDDEKVATVSQQGVITAVSPGTANISITTDNGKSASCKVIVPQQPTSVTLTPSKTELLMGRSVQLAYSFQPSNAMTKSVSWASSDSKVATVSQDGKVTAHRPGTARITAKTYNGVVGTCTVTVPVPVFQLFIVKKSGLIDGYLSTDQPQFSMEGETIHFKTDKTAFDITKEELDYFTLEQVLPEHPKTVSLPKTLKVGLGRTLRLPYEFTPANADTKITWFNSSPDIVSIADNGMVTGLKVGTARITLQTSNGLRAACEVTVPEPQWKFFVWERNGRTLGYDLEEHPDAALKDAKFLFTTTKVRIEYPAESIIKFTLQDAAVDDPTQLTPSLRGDVNQDGKVDISDIVAIINVIASGRQNELSDVNSDRKTDISDIVAVINIIAGK